MEKEVTYVRIPVKLKKELKKMAKKENRTLSNLIVYLIGGVA